MSPYIIGGSTIKEVHLDRYVSEDPPTCYEAGTPNIEGAIAFGYAIDYLDEVGMENIHANDKHLIAHALEGMKRITNVNIYGSTDEKDRLSVITFNVKDVGCHAVAKVLSLRENIMIRSGFHCAQPLHDRLGIGPTARLSFYLYNTVDEIDKAVKLLGKVAEFI